jgi:hypothetical protein
VEFLAFDVADVAGSTGEVRTAAEAAGERVKGLSGREDALQVKQTSRVPMN